MNEEILINTSNEKNKSFLPFNINILEGVNSKSEKLIEKVFIPGFNEKGTHFLNIYDLIGYWDETLIQSKETFFKNLDSFVNVKIISDIENVEFWKKFRNIFQNLFNDEKNLARYKLILANAITLDFFANSTADAWQLLNSYCEANKIDFSIFDENDFRPMEKYFKSYNFEENEKLDVIVSKWEITTMLSSLLGIEISNKTTNQEILNLLNELENIKTSNELFNNEIEKFKIFVKAIYSDERIYNIYYKNSSKIVENKAREELKEKHKKQINLFIGTSVSFVLSILILIIVPTVCHAKNNFDSGFSQLSWVLAIIIFVIGSIVTGILALMTLNASIVISKTYKYDKAENTNDDIEKISDYEKTVPLRNVFEEKKTYKIFEYINYVFITYGFLGFIFTVNKFIAEMKKKYIPLKYSYFVFGTQNSKLEVKELEDGFRQVILYSHNNRENIRETFRIKENNKKNGKHEIFDSNNKLIYSCFFNDNVKEEKEILFTYNEIAKPLYVVTYYNNGIIDGEQQIYESEYKMENLIKSTFFKQGLKDGNEIIYGFSIMTGQKTVKEITQYKNGIKHGFHYVINDAEDISQSEAYLNGNKVTIAEYEQETGDQGEKVFLFKKIVNSNISAEEAQVYKKISDK